METKEKELIHAVISFTAIAIIFLIAGVVESL